LAYGDSITICVFWNLKMKQIIDEKKYFNI